MLTIVFGAGASYDAVPAFPPAVSHLHRLPLADELFENRGILADVLAQARLKSCWPIVPRLRKAGVSVEQELERLSAESERFPEGRRQLAAVRYYIQMAMALCGEQWLIASRGITNYVALLDQIDRYGKADEPVLLVTFNYDLMLEHALALRGRTFSTIADYVADPRYKLVKVHGSVNWGRQIVGPPESMRVASIETIIDRNIETAAEIRLSNGYFVVPSQPQFGSPPADHGIPLYPAIAIPLQDSKTDFECHQTHVEVMKELLGRTTKLLTIGWRGRERHFLKLLREANCTTPWVHAVGGSRETAEATLAALKEGGIFGPQEASERGFSGFVESGEIEAFLKRGEIPAPANPAGRPG
jgi:hypothetical protein